MVWILFFSLCVNGYLLWQIKKVTKKAPKICYMEKRIEVPDKEMVRLADKLSQVYKRFEKLETLKEINNLRVEKTDTDWVVYEKVCYYGGCEFGKVLFHSEYEAYRHAAILSLLTDIRKITDKELLSTKIADINYACEKFKECSGIEA